MAKHVVPRSAGTREERFWLHVDKSAGPDACWSWVGAKIGKQGAVNWDKKVYLAYEIAFILTAGPLPEGTSTRLACGSIWCCNPAHVERIDQPRKTRRPRGTFASKAEASAFYRETDRVRHNADRRNYLARRKQAEGSHTKDDIEILLRLQKRRCAVCGRKLENPYHVDHITPLIKGGRNDRRNLQLLCPDCNIRKRAKDPIEFMRELGRLL